MKVRVRIWRMARDKSVAGVVSYGEIPGRWYATTVGLPKVFAHRQAQGMGESRDEALAEMMEDLKYLSDGTDGREEFEVDF